MSDFQRRGIVKALISCAADLLLCFRLCKKAGLLMTWLNYRKKTVFDNGVHYFYLKLSMF